MCAYSLHASDFTAVFTRIILTLGAGGTGEGGEPLLCWLLPSTCCMAFQRMHQQCPAGGKVGWMRGAEGRKHGKMTDWQAVLLNILLLSPPPLPFCANHYWHLHTPLFSYNLKLVCAACWVLLLCTSGRYMTKLPEPTDFFVLCSPRHTPGHSSLLPPWKLLLILITTLLAMLQLPRNIQIKSTASGFLKSRASPSPTPWYPSQWWSGLMAEPLCPSAWRWSQVPKTVQGKGYLSFCSLGSSVIWRRREEVVSSSTNPPQFSSDVHREPSPTLTPSIMSCLLSWHLLHTAAYWKILQRWSQVCVRAKQHFQNAFWPWGRSNHICYAVRMGEAH